MIETVDATPCGSYNLHDTHTYRTGFLWLTKKSCHGSAGNFPVETSTFTFPEEYMHPNNVALIPMEIVEHKHDYKLQKEYSFGAKEESDVLWLCDWFDCNHYFVMDRNIFWTIGIHYDIKV